MGPKVVKNGQNCPKIGEINRGGPPENPNESQKYRKNGPKPSHSAIWKCTKNVKSAKNWQKSARIMKKNRFSLQQLPKKGHFLKEMHPKKKSPSAKKKSKKVALAARYTTATSPPGGAIEFLESRILGFCPYTEAWSARDPFGDQKKSMRL